MTDAFRTNHLPYACELQAYLLFGRHDRTRVLVREALAVCHFAACVFDRLLVSPESHITECQSHGCGAHQVLRGVDAAQVDGFTAAVRASILPAFLPRCSFAWPLRTNVRS
jgi:hypothetical protein